MTAKPRLKKNYSLRKRLVLSIIGVSVFFWLASLGIMVYVSWSQTNEMFDEALKKSAVLLLQAAQSESFTFDEKIDHADRKLDDDDLHYQILYHGRVVSKTEDAPGAPFIVGFRGHKGFADVQVGDESWRIYVLRSQDSAFEVQIGQALEMRLEILEDLAEDLVMPALVLLALLSILSALLIYYLLKPLTQMAKALEGASVYEMKPLEMNSRSQELNAIAYALNVLLERLGVALSSERQFTADAAHELRTPLAALKMKAQLLGRTHPEMKEVLQELGQDIDRATRLVDHLLLLARLDPLNYQDQKTLPKTQLDVPSLFTELESVFAGKAVQKQIVLKVQPQAVQLCANAEMVYIAVKNLIDNAIRYCPSGSMVRIFAKEDASKVTLGVEDNGDGLSEVELKRVTQRFYRVLGSGQNGSGLGLSIVEKIMQLHQGDLRISSGGGHKGLCVLLVFPKNIEG